MKKNIFAIIMMLLVASTSRAQYTDYSGLFNRIPKQQSYFKPTVPDKSKVKSSVQRRGQKDKNGRIIDLEYEVPNMGGTTHVTLYKDGYALYVNNLPCPLCYAKGTCSLCGGRGYVYQSYLNVWNPCPSCGTTGKCKYCHGKKGQVMTKLFAPGEAEAYLQAVRGVKKDSRRQNSSPDNGGRRERKGMEVIVYDPNYTGDYVEVWCDKCKKRMAPHRHVWKTY